MLTEGMNGQGKSISLVFLYGSIGLFMAAVAPLLAGYILGIQPGAVIELVLGTLIIEYGAVVIGTALGIGSAATFIIAAFVATGIIILQFSLFDFMGHSSITVSRYLERIREKYGSSPSVKKYGVIAPIPGMLVVGFYVCPAVSWLIGWDRKISCIVMAGTFYAVSLILLPISNEVVGIITALSG